MKAYSEKPEYWLELIFGKMLALEVKSRSLRENESEVIQKAGESKEFPESEIWKLQMDLEHCRIADERSLITHLLQYAGIEAHSADVRAAQEFRKEQIAAQERSIESNLSIAAATKEQTTVLREILVVLQMMVPENQ
jgi:hypothetical protein